MADSPLQKNYLLREKQKKQFISLMRILLFFLFLGLWELSARLGWIDSFIFSSPSQIILTFWDMTLHQELFSHISITLMETLVSFLLVLLFSLGISLLLWLSPRLSAILEPYLEIGRASCRERV